MDITRRSFIKYVTASAAALGWIIIMYGVGKVSLIPFELIIPSLRQIAFFVGACTLLGLASGYLGIRRFLR